MLKVDEYREDGDMVTKAQIPGIDPDKDLHLTVDDGILDLRAERSDEDTGPGRRERPGPPCRPGMSLDVPVRRSAEGADRAG